MNANPTDRTETPTNGFDQINARRIVRTSGPMRAWKNKMVNECFGEWKMNGKNGNLHCRTLQHLSGDLVERGTSVPATRRWHHAWLYIFLIDHVCIDAFLHCSIMLSLFSTSARGVVAFRFVRSITRSKSLICVSVSVRNVPVTSKMCIKIQFRSTVKNSDRTCSLASGPRPSVVVPLSFAIGRCGRATSRTSTDDDPSSLVLGFFEFVFTLLGH